MKAESTYEQRGKCEGSCKRKSKIKLTEKQGEEYVYHEGNERPGTSVIDTEREERRRERKRNTRQVRGRPSVK